jgi:hypothetical protein
MEPEIDQAARKERDRERRLRGRAKSLGLWMRKSRARHLSLDNQGRYMLIDSYRNICLAGSQFGLSLN